MSVARASRAARSGDDKKALARAPGCSPQGSRAARAGDRVCCAPKECCRCRSTGREIKEFGAPDSAGGTEKGLSIATRAGAQVTRAVRRLGRLCRPFRSYGQLLIINAGGGYHVLLAGMERIDVELGQFVLAGEPVAVMGERLASGRRLMPQAPASRCSISNSGRTGLRSIRAPGGPRANGEKVGG